MIDWLDVAANGGGRRDLGFELLWKDTLVREDIGKTVCNVIA